MLFKWQIPYISFLVLFLFVFSSLYVHAADDIFDDEDGLISAPPAPDVKFDNAPDVNEAPFYRIGPKDSLTIFVWGHPDLSTSAVVRPDGRITLPLAEDIPVTNRTPTQLAREIEKVISTYVRDPIVSVTVSGFLGPYNRQIRVLGEAANPQALPFTEGMTLLDLMIVVGGITDFAAGNKARIVRMEDGEQKVFLARLDDLIRDGDISANIDLLPGDTLIIPESWF